MVLLLSLLISLALSTVGSYIHIPGPDPFSRPGFPSDLPWVRLNGTAAIPATYDYIVVGGGTAGITVAARLGEAGLSVALVEAGGLYEIEFPPATIPASDNIGAGADANRSKSPIDWGFVAKGVPGANYRDIHYPRGKCLGGSSATNYMIYQRPTRKSMQIWAQFVNDSSYLYDNVLPFYQKTVHFTPPNLAYREPNATALYNESAFDADGGPLEVSYANYAMPFSSWVKLGMEAIGIKETADFNSGSLMGSQYCASTIRASDQTRSSSHSAFFDGPAQYPRLVVYPYTMAKKIIFDSLNSARGVVVQTGAIQSPQLLMVSGIGPAETLAEFGIDIVSDLPGVGQNMWDHVYFGPTFRVNVLTFTKVITNMSYLLSQVAEYNRYRRGPLTNPVSDFLAWEKIPRHLRAGFSSQTKADLARFPNDWPELEYISGSGYVGNNSGLLESQPKDGYEYGTILTSLVAPTSRGNVTIMSSDTADPPVINPNWLHTETDREVAVASYKRMREAFHSPAMAPVIIGDEYYPGSEYSTDEQILEAIKNSVMTIYHAACTCKMGTREDAMAVVDSEARVFGVHELRVVDASAFPILPPGHPQSTVYMLAEKIVAKILES